MEDQALIERLQKKKIYGLSEHIEISQIVEGPHQEFGNPTFFMVWGNPT